MRSRKMLHKGMAFILAAAMLLGTGVPAVAAETKSDAANAIRLDKTEGTVSLYGQDGNVLAQSYGMRLYHGNRLTTETSKRSYAWMKLDDNKSVKLNASSEAEIRKNKKKLEVVLLKGDLFFDVSKPLEEEEELNIRTATMVMGVRGTSGILTAVDENTTILKLLDGVVEGMVKNPDTGEMRSLTVHAGEKARFSVLDDNGDGSMDRVQVEKLVTKDLPGFAMTEFPGNSALTDRIYQESGLDVRKVTKEQADSAVRWDEAAASIRTYFDPQYYASHNPDVTAVYGQQASQLYQHYVDYGQYEERPVSAEEAALMAQDKEKDYQAWLEFEAMLAKLKQQEQEAQAAQDRDSGGNDAAPTVARAQSSGGAQSGGSTYNPNTNPPANNQQQQPQQGGGTNNP